MLNKKIMMLAILLVSLLAISAVSAAENATSDVVSVDQTNGEITSGCASDVNETVVASEAQIGAVEAGTDEGSIIIEETNEQSHDDVLSVKDYGIFSDLKKMINEADEGSTITLENDYVYDDGFEDEVITISKPLTLNGNGHSINAKSKSGIFYTKCNVNLYNITFMNGYSRHGGAIETSLNVGCNINSCTFLNCWAKEGGAIYTYINNRVDNTIFSNITSCTFTNCYANSTNAYGGAIYGGGYSIIDSCNFTDCFSMGYSSYGGAITGISDNSIISSCNFTNCRVDCTAFADGGVISSSANNLTIFACCFTNCFASADGYTCGGAIYAYGNGLNVTSCSFQDCSASKGANAYGGAIYNEGSDSTINSCSFTRCSAYRGGAIYNKLYAGTANNCKFINITETEADNLTEYIGCYYCESIIITGDVSCIYLNSKVTSTFLDADGKALGNARVTFRIENTDYPSTTNVNGVATANVNLGVGTYYVTAINPVTNQQKTFKLTISKAYSVIALTSAQTRYGIAIYASITPSNADGSVIFDFGGKTYAQSISHGKATLTLSGLAEGNYNISARYNGDSNLYESSSKILTFTINPSIIINDIIGEYYKTKVTATFLDGNNNPLASHQVTFYVDDLIYSATTDADGVASASVDLDVGEYTVTAVNPASGDEKQFKLVVSKADSKIELSISQDNDAVNLTAVLSPSKATGNVTFTVNGKTHTTPINAGKATLKLTGLEADDYVAGASYSGNGNLNPSSSKSVTFTVLDVYPILTAGDVSKFYGGSENLQITLKDSLGNKIKNADINVIANGKTLTVETDSNGKATVDLDWSVGNYDVTLSYQSASATSKIYIKSTINAADAAGTYSNSKITATFLNAAGNALASKQVTFKIGDNSYSATTDANGVASTSIPLGVGTYTVTAVNPATKEEKQFKLTISKASSTTALTTVQNGKSVTLTATVTPSAATGKVTFEINGKTKEASLSNGKASATFSDLSENTYTAKAIYNGDANFKVSSATASVKVDKFYSIINVGDAERVYLDSKVSATFMDVNGKALANTKVTFKIGSKSYSATTNSNGAATADIPLGVGTYTVTAVNPTTKEEKQFKLTVTKGTSSVSLNHVLNGNSVTLTATLTPASATGGVVFNVNGIKYTRTISNGKAVLTLSDESVKEFAVTANYAGDANLNAASQASASFNIKDSIIMDDTRGSYGNSKLTATFLDENGRALANTKVTFKAGGKSFTATTNSDGVASVNVDLDAGNYTVTALNPVTNKQKNSKLVINKINSSISVSSVINDDLVEFTARLTPGYLTGEVTFAMGKLSFNEPISNGRAVLNLGGFDPGTHSISVEYAGDKNIEPSKAVYLFEVKQTPWMCADDLTKTYGSSKKLTIEFLNHDVISANPQVSVLLNGKNTTLDIDSNGKASLPINLAPNRYTATVYYAGDDTFNQASQTVNILVKKAAPKLTAAKKTFKKSVKIKKYTVALKTSQNKAMKSTWVSLKVNKKTYKVKTNSKGQATFKITNLKKKGTFTAIVKYSGSKYYNAKTVKPKITVK